MAAAMAPTIAEFAMILLADDEVVVVELDGGPVVVDVVSELVETRGLVVVVLFWQQDVKETEKWKHARLT